MSPSTSSSRWCPTPEQLMILEELYTRGLRTPNASQIQKITAHLAFHGKIQGKNVFYWFQNHKARDRQKLRKKLARQLHQQHQLYQHPLYQYTHAPDFQAFHQLSAENLHHAQGNGACEEIPNMTWSADLTTDCLMRTYGHDSVMIMDMGPTFPCCRSKPLETLELFPLRSPNTATTSK